MILRRPSHAALSILVSLTLWSGCKNPAPTTDPVQTEMAAYKQSVEPPIQKSEEIAKVFVQIVLDDKGNPDPDRAAQRIQSEVLPKAQEFLEQVKTITPRQQGLVDLHQFLVQAATLRVEGYQQIVDGYSKKNLETFTQGQKKVTESKIQEDNYIAQADRLLRNYGYELVYFSAPPSTTN